MARSCLSVIAGAVLFLCAGPAAAQPDRGVYGFWETRGDEPGEADFIVELMPCPQAQHALCCFIEWLAPGEAEIDTKNPDPALRGRSLIGVQFLSGFTREAPGLWSGGAVYNPRQGQTYSGAIRQIGPDRLELEGCAALFFCRTQVWHRVAPGDPRLMGGAAR